MRDTVITGVGSTRFAKHDGRSIESLAVEAARAALDRAGLDRKEIGALYLGNFCAGPLVGQEVLAGIVADELGLANIPCTKVEGACASGGIAFRHAVMAVQAGFCDAVLVVGVEKMTHASGAAVTAALNCAMDNRSDGPSGLTFPGLFGLAYRIHADLYGTTRDELSAVIIKNKANGLKNPLAQMGAELTADIIRQSQPIADPLQLYDCCPVSDGASAIIVTAADRGRASPDVPIRVRSVVQTRGPARVAGHESIVSYATTREAAARAFEQAGVTAPDIDVAEIHDCFSMAEVMHSEDLGLVPRGMGAKWAADGRTRVGGDIPINPSGGLLSKGHPVGATGVGQLYEVVQQLRGRHPNQVAGAALGLTQNVGGAGVACTVSILERSDA
ncbi:MAG: thiolase family protein [Hyphomicrobiales bacterium]|nr:thiolase family protein [Hyphomicrobiales bacterium]